MKNTDMKQKDSLEMSIESYNELKEVYENAVEEKKDTLFFQNKELFTKYVKYMLEHLKSTYKL